jgi:hypothetical protein
VDDYAQFALACRDSAGGIVDACGPGSPGSHPGGLGPHLTSSGFPCGLSSGFPFARRVLPLRPPSLRPALSGSFPSAVARFRFPRRFPSGFPFALSDLYLTAAAGRFPGHWSRAAGTKVTSSAATTSPGIARSARTADGQRLSTMGCRRIACYGRPRATGHRRARTAQIGGSRSLWGRSVSRQRSGRIGGRVSFARRLPTGRS